MARKKKTPSEPSSVVVESRAKNVQPHPISTELQEDSNEVQSAIITPHSGESFSYFYLLFSRKL